MGSRVAAVRSHRRGEVLNTRNSLYESGTERGVYRCPEALVDSVGRRVLAPFSGDAKIHY